MAKPRIIRSPIADTPERVFARGKRWAYAALDRIEANLAEWQQDRWRCVTASNLVSLAERRRAAWEICSGRTWDRLGAC